MSAARLHIRRTVPATLLLRVRRAFVTGALLLGGLVAPDAARAQMNATAKGSGASDRDTSRAIEELERQAAARVAAAVCDRRIVLLGELPDHGHARGFGVKARVVEHLVTRCGFRAVLFEAGSYDFFGFERAVAAARAAGEARADSLDLALGRAMGGFWWTRELAGWRGWLAGEAVAGRVALGGLDDQPGATSAYAKAMLPGLVAAAAPSERAAECREAVARYMGWTYSDAAPHDGAERQRLADCTALAARTSAVRAPERRTPDDIMLDDAASFFAREHAMAERRPGDATDRDLVMARHVAWWVERLPRDAKIVVWTATTHAARAPGANPVLPRDVPPLGARLAERWGEQLAAIGFTALRGEWSRGGRPGQPLVPLPPDALEARALAAAAAGDSATWAWLDREALRSLGAAPSRLFGKVATTDWSAAFDGVLVIRVESPPTFEPRR